MVRLIAVCRLETAAGRIEPGQDFAADARSAEKLVARRQARLPPEPARAEATTGPTLAVLAAPPPEADPVEADALLSPPAPAE